MCSINPFAINYCKEPRIQSDARLKKCTVQLWEKELYTKKTSQRNMDLHLGFERKR